MGRVHAQTWQGILLVSRSRNTQLYVLHHGRSAVFAVLCNEKHLLIGVAGLHGHAKYAECKSPCQQS